MVVILELAAADSLEWVHKVVLAVFDTFVLFVTTNTKVELVLAVVQKCSVQIFR
jgi:hypothetical protein